MLSRSMMRVRWLVNRSFTENERGGDLLSAYAARNEADDLALAAGELLIDFWRCRGFVQELAGLAAVENTACRHAIDGAIRN